MGSYRLVKMLNPVSITVAGTFTPKGAYSGSTSYSVGDQVDYNGTSYILYSAASAGTLPTDNTKWGVLASKGDTGSAGTPGTNGIDGAKGDKGDKGDTGAMGIQGVKGDTGAVGATGATGSPGSNGTNGTNGQGVPTGGTTGQQLAKINGTDYNTQWVNPVDISGKQDTLVSGTSIKTINSTSLLGSGDIVVAAGSDPLKEDVANKSTATTLGTSDTLYPSQKAVKTYVDTTTGAYVPLAGGTMTGTLTGRQVAPSADSTYTLGTSSAYWSNTYTDRLYLNSTAYLDGGTAGVIGVTGGLTVAGNTQTRRLILSTGFVTDGIYGDVTSGLVRLSGGTLNDGAVIILGGSTHSSVANIGILRVGATSVVSWNVAGLFPTFNLGASLGSSSNYFSNTYTQKLYLNSTAYIDGSTAGVAKLTGRLDIPVTTSTDGQITQGGSTILHTYTRGDGYFPNLYLGKGSGNYTSATTGATYLGTGNLALGFQCLQSITTGYYNIALGNSAGIYLTTGFNNFLAGHTAGNKLTTGSNNFLMGRETGYELTTGSNNVGIGLNVLRVITTAGNNTAVGHTAGFSATGSANIFLGYQAGYNETGSNKLYIANSSTSTPLIGGDFSANTITTPASIEITDTAKGVILKSPDGTRWRVTIDNTGALTTASI